MLPAAGADIAPNLPDCHINANVRSFTQLHDRRKVGKAGII
jgi:hypothetical protein